MKNKSATKKAPKKSAVKNSDRKPRHATETLSQSEEKFRTLFETMDEGLCIIEMIYGKTNQATDFRYLEVNQAWERLTGLGNVVGKLGSEVLPNNENYWNESFDKVAQTGESLRFENYHDDTRRWYSAYISRVGDAGSRRIAIVFDDITERKRRETNLAFLADLQAEFSSLATSEEIMRTAGERIADYFDLTHCLFVEIDESAQMANVIYDLPDAGAHNLLGAYDLTEFHIEDERRRLGGGESVVINNVREKPRPAKAAANFESLGIRALVTAPYHSGGRWRFALSAQCNLPREWREDDRKLLEELSARIYIRIERARAEQSLRESESRLQSIANLVPDLLWDSEPNGSTNWYNNRWLEYTGQSFEEAIGWGWVEVIHPDDRESSAQRYREAVENGVQLRQEHRIRRHDGEYRWFVVNACPLKDKTGKVIKMFGAATDIHESRLMNEALRESEELFRLAADAVPSVLYDWNVQEDKIARSGELKNLLGFSASDPQTQTNEWWKSRLHPNDAEKAIEKVIEKLKSNEYRFEDEYRLQHRDGHYVWVSDTGVLLRDQVGKVRRWVGSATNITARKEFDERLRESEEHLRIAVEAAELGTWDWNLKTDEINWNERHFALFGINPRKKPRRSEAFFKFVHQDDREWLGARLRQAIEKNMTYKAEFRVIRKDGKMRWMEGYGHVTVTDHGEPTRMSGVMRDITNRKRSEEAIRFSEHRLQLILRSITDYAVITTDQQGIINGWNTGAEKLSDGRPVKQSGSRAQLFLRQKTAQKKYRNRR